MSKAKSSKAKSSKAKKSAAAAWADWLAADAALVAWVEEARKERAAAWAAAWEAAYAVDLRTEVARVARKERAAKRPQSGNPPRSDKLI